VGIGYYLPRTGGGALYLRGAAFFTRIKSKIKEAVPKLIDYALNPQGFGTASKLKRFYPHFNRRLRPNTLLTLKLRIRERSGRRIFTTRP
jgi:hypothetical protein